METTGFLPIKVESEASRAPDVRCGEEHGRTERIGSSEEGGRIRNSGDPSLPSKEEVEEHHLSHVLDRNWCPHCVRVRGKDLGHRKAVEEDRKISEFIFVYCFPEEEKGARITVVVGGRERITGKAMAPVVPVKGTSGQFAAMKVLEFVKKCGAAETEIMGAIGECRPHQTGPPGLAHDSPRTPNVHISGPLRFKHHQNSTRRHPETHNENGGRKGKKKREMLGPPPFGAPPFGAPPFGAPPFGAPLFLGSGPPPFWATP